MKVSQARGSNTLPVIITPRPAHKHTIPHPKSKNMSYPSGFIIFRVPESLHQHSQAHVCCEMRHVMTCTFIWGSTGSANSAQSPHGIQAGILWHARAVSLYRANNPIKTSQVTPLFICVRVHQVSLQIHGPRVSVSTDDVRPQTKGIISSSSLHCETHSLKQREQLQSTQQNPTQTLQRRSSKEAEKHFSLFLAPECEHLCERQEQELCFIICCAFQKHSDNIFTGSGIGLV